MTGSLTWLAIAGLVLLGTHFGMSSGPLRRPMVAVMGEGVFKIVYSAISLAAFVWLGWAFADAPPGDVLWALGGWGTALSHSCVLIGLVLLVAGVSGPNPTLEGRMVGGAEPLAVGGALRITRHPLMWAIGLWGIGHLFANGEMRTVLLMGTVTVLALFGTVLLDRKFARREPQRYRDFVVVTSNLPFLAIVTGRQSVRAAFGEIGKVRPAAAVLLYLALFYAHPWLGGVPLSY